MRRSMAAAAALLLVLLLALAAHKTEARGKTYQVGDKIADFTFKNEQGQPVSLSQFKGKIVVLNFYASW